MEIPMRNGGLKVVGLLACALSAGQAMAGAESDWWANAGVASVSFSESAVLKVGGAVVPGAGAAVKNNVTAVFEIGRRLDDGRSVSLTFGLPPETEVTGTGTASALGLLGKAKYGAAVLGIQQQFGEILGWKPHVGIGVARLVVTDTEDGALTGLKIEDRWGTSLQIGASHKLASALRLFVDVKKIWLKSSGSGSVPAFGGAPATADFKLNPMLVHIGVGMDF